jgi:hypothetical protein
VTGLLLDRVRLFFDGKRGRSSNFLKEERKLFARFADAEQRLPRWAGVDHGKRRVELLTLAPEESVEKCLQLVREPDVVSGQMSNLLFKLGDSICAVVVFHDAFLATLPSRFNEQIGKLVRDSNACAIDADRCSQEAAASRPPRLRSAFSLSPGRTHETGHAQAAWRAGSTHADPSKQP